MRLDSRAALGLAIALASLAACTPIPYAQLSRPIQKNDEAIVFAGYMTSPPTGNGWKWSAPARLADANVGFGKAVDLLGRHTVMGRLYGRPLERELRDAVDPLQAYIDAWRKEQAPTGRTRQPRFEWTAGPWDGCATLSYEALDVGVPSQEGKPFTLTAHGVICLHPTQPGYLVAVEYSDRAPPGEPAYAPLRDELAPTFERLRFTPIPYDIDAILLDAGIRGATVAAEQIWLGTEKGDLVAVDPVTMAVTRRVEARVRGLTEVIAAHGSVWVTDAVGSEVLRVEPTTGELVARISVGVTPTWLAASEDAVWVTDRTRRTVSRIDATTNTVTAEVGGFDAIGGITFAGGYLWLAVPPANRVVKIDPRTAKVVDSLSVGTGALRLGAHGDDLWVTLGARNQLGHLSMAKGGRFDLVSLPGSSLAVLDDGAHVWVLSAYENTLTCLDRTTHELCASPLGVGAYPSALVAYGGYVWVASAADGLLVRLKLREG